MLQDLKEVISVKNNLQQDIIRMYNNHNEIIWEKQEVIYDESDYKNQYFTIEALCYGQFRINHEAKYRKNKGSWETFIPNGPGEYNTVWISCNAGDKVELSINLDDTQLQFFWDGIRDNDFNFYYNVYGNILSLVYGDNFYGRNSINTQGLKGILSYSACVSAKNLILPETLSQWCFNGLFSHCYNLEKAPLLPASYVPYMAYASMFSYCYKLKYVECYAINADPYAFSGWLDYTNDIGTFATKLIVYNRNASNWLQIPEGWEILLNISNQ